MRFIHRLSANGKAWPAAMADKIKGRAISLSFDGALLVGVPATGLAEHLGALRGLIQGRSGRVVVKRLVTFPTTCRPAVKNNRLEAWVVKVLRSTPF